jgi:hypothetical protein
LIVPADATILTTHDGLTEEGFFNQALRSVNDSPASLADRTTITRTKGHCRAALSARHEPGSAQPAVGAASGAGGKCRLRPPTRLVPVSSSVRQSRRQGPAGSHP